MEKRAQLFSHPFTMILTLVVSAAILIFGVIVIRDLISVSNQIDMTSFSNNFNNEVAAIYNLDEESQKTISFSLPKQIEYICVVNRDSDIDTSKIPNNKASLVNAFKDSNVFFIAYQNQPSPEKLSLKIENLKASENPLCIKTLSRLDAKLINKGAYVEITK